MIDNQITEEQLLSQGSSHEDDAEEDDDEKKKEKDDEPPKANRMWEQTYKPGLFGRVMMWFFFVGFTIMFITYYYVAT